MDQGISIIPDESGTAPRPPLVGPRSIVSIRLILTIDGKRRRVTLKAKGLFCRQGNSDRAIKDVGKCEVTTDARGVRETMATDMTLTAAGIAEGFTLTTFASNFPNNGLGPLGIAFPNSGCVLVIDGPGNVRLFPTDTDGQNAASAPVAQNYGSGRAFDMAKSGGNIFMTQRNAGAVA